MSTAIVWFRRDLRLADNPALDAARRAHERILPVYIHAPDEERAWAPGAASRWWLHHSLTALDADLRQRGNALHVCVGSSEVALLDLVRVIGAEAVYWNRLYEPAAIARDRRVKQVLREHGIEAQSFNASLLVEPWTIATGRSEPYKVFTPFWRNARQRLAPHPPLEAPRHLPGPPVAGSLTVEVLRLLPRIRWDEGLQASWRPGERDAATQLARFCDEALADYPERRDFPAESSTSRLSAPLHFGELSPMQVLWAIESRALAAAGQGARLRAGAESFIRELGWREFSYHLLFHFPQTPERSLDPQFDRFPWRDDDGALLARWRHGRTGVPIIDAGLRELWTTGWMHNRVRMIVASFLTKNLRLPWQHGARWFWDTLVDADLANNTQGWQWTAGCGADAAPFFRIFNPVTQGERFDPDGTYVRRWIPEISGFEKNVIHAPWTQPARLARSGYPAPMVDLRSSREAALAAYRQMRAA